jgi:hypothetical protein
MPLTHDVSFSDSQSQADIVSDKQGLASRFATFVQGSMAASCHGDKVMVQASQELWREMLQVCALLCVCMCA